MRDSNQYNIGGISSSQKGVDNLGLGAERVSMKAIIPLAVLAMAGSAFADPIFTQADYDRIHSQNESLSRYLASGPKMTDTIPSNEEACRPTKVDYTIVALPDGQTASALTFK